jgi:arabinogalactan oligomer/maltooligosaccharide transport system permease protein
LVGYTEFAIGWLFVESSQNVTLAMAVSGMMRMAGTEWSSLAAISILMSLPVVLLFFLLSKYLLRGQLIGRIEE